MSVIFDQQIKIKDRPLWDTIFQIARATASRAKAFISSIGKALATAIAVPPIGEDLYCPHSMEEWRRSRWIHFRDL